MTKYVDIYCPEISPRALITHVIDKTEDDHYRIEVDRDFLRTVGEMADW